MCMRICVLTGKEVSNVLFVSVQKRWMHLTTFLISWFRTLFSLSFFLSLSW